MDDYLGGTPRQYRETQYKESKIFMNYFKSKGGIKLVARNIRTGKCDDVQWIINTECWICQKNCMLDTLPFKQLNWTCYKINRITPPPHPTRLSPGLHLGESKPVFLQNLCGSFWIVFFLTETYCRSVYTYCVLACFQVHPRWSGLRVHTRRTQTQTKTDAC